MERVKDFIIENELIKPGEVIGVGVSGGSDSMALLYKLQSLQEELDFEVVAIHVNHGIREESTDEAEFVMKKCKELGVRSYKFKIDAPKLAKEKKESIETSARDGRYEIFKSLIKRGVVDKIALAHHESDQAETILMHIFRGAGIAGARGMSAVRDKVFIRPILEVSKKEINDYITNNNIDFVEDSSNKDNSYNRNFVRNVLLPQICERWPGAEKAIVSFGKTVGEDDDFINQSVFDYAVLYDEGIARIPRSYFIYQSPIVNRLLIKVLKNIGVTKDFEKKHIEMIKDLAMNAENGSKIKLPFDIFAIKEYEYITLLNKHKEEVDFSCEFKFGEIDVPNYGKIITKRAKVVDLNKKCIYLDYKKIPKEAVWRFRKDGDVFTKFGGGTKKLKSYLIDKKIPQRERKFLPVLADENNILAIAGLEISESVRIDENTKSVVSVSVKKINNNG